MSREENQGMGRLSMGEGNLRTRCSSECGGDAGNNFKLDVRLAERGDFLADPPKDQGIAAFEAHHQHSGGSQRDHEEVDLFLADVLLPAALANVLILGVGGRELKYLFSDEVVVQHGVCVFQHADVFESQQFRIAGARADEIDFACHTSALLAVVLESVAIEASNASALA